MTNQTVLVKWRDITTSGLGWSEQNEVDTFVTDENENIVYQVGFLYEQSLWGNVTKIPSGCVLEVTYLK